MCRPRPPPAGPPAGSGRGAGRRLLLGLGLLLALFPLPATQQCIDASPAWVDASGLGCADYRARRLCTAAGAAGPGWDPAWGSLAQYGSGGRSAVDVCCACGGGLPDNCGANRTVDTVDCRAVEVVLTSGLPNVTKGWAIAPTCPAVAATNTTYWDRATVCLQPGNYTLAVAVAGAGPRVTLSVRLESPSAWLVEPRVVADGASLRFAVPGGSPCVVQNVDVPGCVNVSLNTTVTRRPPAALLYVVGTCPLLAVVPAAGPFGAEHSVQGCLAPARYTARAVDTSQAAAGWGDAYFRVLLGGTAYELMAANVPDQPFYDSVFEVPAGGDICGSILNRDSPGCRAVRSYTLAGATSQWVGWRIKGSCPVVYGYYSGATPGQLEAEDFCLQPGNYTLRLVDTRVNEAIVGQEGLFGLAAPAAALAPA